MTEAEALPQDVSGNKDEQPRLPFSFARRHGVVLKGLTDDGRLETVCRPGVKPLTLAELRRHTGHALKLTHVSE